MGLTDQPDLAHLHVVVGADGLPIHAWATTVTGVCLPIDDFQQLATLTIEAAAACPSTGGGLVDGSGTMWRIERFAGVNGTVLVLARGAEPPDRLEDLGLDKAMANELANLGAAHERGLVLILGDMKAGKSLLAKAMIKDWLQRYGGMAFEWSDPVEHPLPARVGNGGYVPISVSPEEYPQAALAARRSRARYFLFGEARRDDAMASVIQASLVGPVCVTTAHGFGLLPGLIAFADGAGREDPRAHHQLAVALRAVYHVQLQPTAPGQRWQRLAVTETLHLGRGHGDSGRALIRAGNVGQLGTQIRTADRVYRGGL